MARTRISTREGRIHDYLTTKVPFISIFNVKKVKIQQKIYHAAICDDFDCWKIRRIPIRVNLKDGPTWANYHSQSLSEEISLGKCGFVVEKLLKLNWEVKIDINYKSLNANTNWCVWFRDNREKNKYKGLDSSALSQSNTIRCCDNLLKMAELTKLCYTSFENMNQEIFELEEPDRPMLLELLLTSGVVDENIVLKYPKITRYIVANQRTPTHKFLENEFKDAECENKCSIDLFHANLNPQVFLTNKNLNGGKNGLKLPNSAFQLANRGILAVSEEEWNFHMTTLTNVGMSNNLKEDRVITFDINSQIVPSKIVPVYIRGFVDSTTGQIKFFVYYKHKSSENKMVFSCIVENLPSFILLEAKLYSGVAYVEDGKMKIYPILTLNRGIPQFVNGFCTDKNLLDGSYVYDNFSHTMVYYLKRKSTNTNTTDPTPATTTIVPVPEEKKEVKKSEEGKKRKTKKEKNKKSKKVKVELDNKDDNVKVINNSDFWSGLN